MNGFLLLLPFFAVRFGLLAVLDQGAVRRAAHFAPMSGGERVAYGIYQLATAFVVLYPLCLTVHPGVTWHFVIGVLCGAVGLALCIASMSCFARPDSDGLCTGGVYRLCPDDRFGGIDVRGAGVSSFCTLDHSGRRTLVPANFWRTLPRLYEEGAAIHIEKIL